ncbi:MAG TPA: response regulator [Verrucomicrobiae bacterium]|nr:response regulator [Verrucomicrobiae bacterium]
MEQEFRTTFLVLEDDANDALLIRRAFTNAACSAFVCRNTSEARAYLVGAGMYADRTRFPFPDIFITDLRLGDESGLQFLEWLRAKKELKDLPVIILSGKATQKDIAAAKALGVSRIWNKPGDAAALQKMIRELGEELVSPTRFVDDAPARRRAAHRH